MRVEPEQDPLYVLADFLRECPEIEVAPISWTG